VYPCAFLNDVTAQKQFFNSVLIPIGEVPKLNNSAHFFGCSVDYLPSSNLGLPLGATYKCKAVWEPVVERFQKKLSG